MTTDEDAKQFSSTNMIGDQLLTRTGWQTINHRQMLELCAQSIATVEQTGETDFSKYSDQDIRHALLYYPVIEEHYLEYCRINKLNDCIER